MPIDRILIETDFPFMSQNVKDDGRNIFNTIKTIKNVGANELTEQLNANALKLFKKMRN